MPNDCFLPGLRIPSKAPESLEFRRLPPSAFRRGAKLHKARRSSLCKSFIAKGKKETTYPRGMMRAFRFSKTPLRVYESSFIVLMKLRASGTAPIGKQKIPLTVSYQACNEDACLPPTSVPATADLEIAGEDTTPHLTHPEIFSSASAEKTK